ncbi:MAG: 4Fe-4S binding protein [Alistipes sp.]|nr:4Fe-4S binding protein [Candidatus Alistipes equi]
MLRKLRIIVALTVFVAITLLFLDFTGVAQTHLNFLSKIQFIPALIALNLVVVVVLLLLTLIFGRLYCSILCPLGIMQDIFGFFGRKQKKNRYRFSPEKKWLRRIVLIVFVIALIVGVPIVTTILSPYSSYGRIAQNILAPIYGGCNNILGYLSEKFDGFTFYTTDIFIRSIVAFIVACVTLLVLSFLAWRNGRTYCNTICPVGTILGFVSKYSILRPWIDTSKCNGCGKCARNCKSACINPKKHEIDTSRCVTCFDCIEKCSQNAIHYSLRRNKEVKKKSDKEKDGISRRTFLSITGVALASAAAYGKKKITDGGLAEIVKKEEPERRNKIIPAGAESYKHLERHCSGCQLCVAACPQKILRPSWEAENFMQVEASFEHGYCPDYCTKCSEVCPTGAIKKITEKEKTDIKIGHACVRRKYCIPIANGDKCGLCAEKCPVGAIEMVNFNRSDPSSPLVPAVNAEKCIGCGKCEYYCPARPISAIYVEGYEVHMRK